MAMIPVNGKVYSVLPTSKSIPSVGDLRWFSVQRLPADPLFYADIVLQNIVVGSRYWIARDSDLTNVLASGVADATEITLPNIPVYANPMLIQVRIRKASEPIKYLPFVTYGYMVRGVITVYCAQIPDSVAS